MNVIDFVLSLLNSTMIYLYLAVFDYDVAPNTWRAIVALLILRVLLCFLASVMVMVGLRQELAKVLSKLGTKISEAKTV
jgi:hypothetical protein